MREREEPNKYLYKRAIFDPPANAISMMMANIECWLSSFVIFQGSGPVLLRNPLTDHFADAFVRENVGHVYMTLWRRNDVRKFDADAILF